MFFDRVSAKCDAKRIIRDARPSPVLVTAVYLLLTTGIARVVDIFITDPFFEAVGYVLDGYDPLSVYAHLFGGRGAAIAIFVSILMGLYHTVMAFGYDSYILRTSRGEQSGYRDLLDGFELVVKVVVLDFLVSAAIALGGMLFIIPGLILIYSLSMSAFCLMDDPEISVLEAMRRSGRLMKGNKLELFRVEFSFFGWVLLMTVVSWVLGDLAGDEISLIAESLFQLWLIPYRALVRGKFYNGLVGWRAPEQYTGPTLEF